MATSSVFSLNAFTVLATGDLVPVMDASDSSQSAHGSLNHITVANFFASIPAPVNVTSASATSLAVGRLGATTPAFSVDSSTASQVAGFKVTGAATGGTVALVVTDSGANAGVSFNAKGSGVILIGNVSTGAVTITPATTVTGLITASAGVLIVAGTSAAGRITVNATTGLVVRGVVGATYDVEIANAAGGSAILVPTATTNVVFSGAVSGITTLAGTGAISGFTTLGLSGAITLTGATANLVLATAGSGIKVAEGSDATMGTGTLSGGTVTINTTKVTANSRIFLSYYGDIGAVPTPLTVSARSVGTSFTVMNAGGLAAGTFVWLLVEPS